MTRAEFEREKKLRNDCRRFIAAEKAERERIGTGIKFLRGSVFGRLEEIASRPPLSTYQEYQEVA